MAMDEGRNGRGRLEWDGKIEFSILNHGRSNEEDPMGQPNVQNEML